MKNGDTMNQYKKTGLLWVLLLAICAVLFAGCINPDEGDFYTTASGTTLVTPEITTATTPEESTPEVTIPAETTPEGTTPEETTPEVTTTEITTPEETTPQETTTEEPTTSPEPEEKIKIYIDQGHNPFLPKQNPDDPNKGWNTGASNESLGLYEQDITYDFGIRLAELLKADGRFEVRLSRPTADTILGTDNESAKAARVEDAAAWEADYFISLHINSYTDSSVSGLEVYTFTGDDTGYEIGEQILDALIESTKLRDRGMKKGDTLYVLKNSKMPAALIEMGFISNENDAILLRDYPELFVQGLYNGILSYFNTLEPATDVIEEET